MIFTSGYNKIENQSRVQGANYFLCVDQKDHFFVVERNQTGLTVQEVPEIDDGIASRICENLLHFDWFHSKKRKKIVERTTHTHTHEYQQAKNERNTNRQQQKSYDR